MSGPENGRQALWMALKMCGEGGFRGGPKNEGQASVCVGAILQNRQTEAARIVTGLTTCATLSSLYTETGWEKLNTRRDIRKLSALFYNIVKGDTPIIYVICCHGLLTRQTTTIYEIQIISLFPVSSNPISKFIFSSHYSSLE